MHITAERERKEEKPQCYRVCPPGWQNIHIIAKEICKEHIMNTLENGDIIDAKITHLEQFGAFCDIGCGIVSMIPIDCISVSRIDQYALGTKANWSSAAAPVSALSGKYTVNYSGTNLCYDNRGGLWYCQYRDAPSTTQPALMYVNSQSEIS